MKLILTNGYPYPYPANLTDEEAEVIAEMAQGVQRVIEGVVHFEWTHTVTVEFQHLQTAYMYERGLGWKQWGNDPLILEAPTSAADGYDHPAIIADGIAYCGFILTEK